MPAPRNLDFWKFFVGQGLSAFGSSFTSFALPLLVYQLTGSATNLAIAFAAGGLPYLLFGLIGGAFADRSNRKRLMIRVDVLRALVIASIPLLYSLDLLAIWWIYLTTFVVTTLSILFDAADFAAVPSLVSSDDLVQANGRIQALYSAVSIAGPPVAGLIAGLIPVADVLYFDALSFLISAVLLGLIRRSFNAETPTERRSIRADVAEGLRYVWSHPVLRNISLMMAMVNFVTVVTWAELVLFAKEKLHATDFQYGLLPSAASVGILVLSLLAGPLRRRFSFGVVALGALALSGLLTIGFALNTRFWVSLVLWGVVAGLGVLFNINTSSLRQAIVPNHMLGRIMSVAMVIAWSANPLGAVVGGYLVQYTSVTLTYVLSGALSFLIPVMFAFSPLGRAERYLNREPDSVAESAASA